MTKKDPPQNVRSGMEPHSSSVFPVINGGVAERFFLAWLTAVSLALFFFSHFVQEPTHLPQTN